MTPAIFKTFGLIAAATFSMTGAALAEQVETSPTVAAEQPASTATAAPAHAGQVQSDADLADMAGGTNTAIALSETDLTAVNSGNEINADRVTSGSISLSGSALSEFNGLGNIIMNTGHNNNLQSSLSVTIVVTE